MPTAYASLPIRLFGIIAFQNLVDFKFEEVKAVVVLLMAFVFFLMTFGSKMDLFPVEGPGDDASAAKC